MEKNKRFIQATVVVLVVGIGYVHNLNKKSFLYQEFNPASITLETNSTSPDTMQVKQSKLYIFTKKIIHTSVQQLISNI